MYKQPENQAYEVPLCERLDVVPLDACLIIEHKQPEALRLAEILDNYAHGDDFQRPVEAARRELIRLHKEVESFNSILDQAFKDQTDAERYMHLKWVITEKPIYFLKLVDKTGDQIDQLMDEHIRSYDE